MSKPYDRTRLALVEAIFHEALDIAAPDRATFVAQRSNHDAEVITEVMALLAGCEESDAMMERPAAELVRSVAGQAHALPKNVGPFRIVRLLGEGGMGSVYEAEQDSPRRRVALKVVHGSAWSNAVKRRFEHEIEILAQLQHPGIARLYQAGIADIGGTSNAYFAMELIDGEPLTRYLRSRSISLPEQLELLARVCDAVHHAHQRGIIHRDLKPANILVEPPGSSGDSIGQPKVLDFGIARDTGADSATIMTRAGEFVGTLGYMSPEQCDALPLDTRSDVYALGIVCFEALAGRLPIAVLGQPVTDAITLMRTSSPTRLGALRADLKGDVETVIHKALEREPDRRYESASELAADLRRIVRNEPILARPASGLYHLRKFAGRNRLLVSSAAAIVIALGAGLATSLVMYSQAEKARKGEAEQTRIAQETLQAVIAERTRADRETELTAAVQKYLIGDLLVAAAPSRLGMNVKLVDVLAYASEHLNERFPDRPEVQGEIRTRLAEIYSELGKYDQAIAQARLATDIFEAQNMRDSERWVSASSTLCNSLRRANKPEEAMEIAAKAKEVAERVLPPINLVRVRAIQSCAESMQRLGRYKEAEELMVKNLPLAESVEELQLNILTPMLSTLGACYTAQNRLDDLLPINRRAYEIELKRHGPDHPMTLAALNNLLNTLINTNYIQEAAELAVDLPARAERVFPAGHPAIFYLDLTAASAMRQSGKLSEALDAARSAYAAA